MFHQNLGKNFKMAAKQAHKGLWVCWPFQGGLQKGSFSGAWYQIQVTGGHFQLVRLTSFPMVCHEAILVVVAANN